MITYNSTYTFCSRGTVRVMHSAFVSSNVLHDDEYLTPLIGQRISTALDHVLVNLALCEMMYVPYSPETRPMIDSLTN